MHCAKIAVLHPTGSIKPSNIDRRFNLTIRGLVTQVATLGTMNANVQADLNLEGAIDRGGLPTRFFVGLDPVCVLQYIL